MALIPRSGATFASLFEYEVTLDDVISVLGFRPLSKKDEALFRSSMGRAIGQWLMAEGGYQGGAKLDISDVQQSLERLAAHLEKADRFLSAADEGVHHVHDIEVASRLVSAIKENPAIGSIETAREIVVAFQAQAKIIAEGARVAAALLELTPTKAGRIRKAWLDEFTRAVMHV